ncbi:MAG: M20/M25/M40 family metallo-hydrolase [Flavobacteriales bacterium]
MPSAESLALLQELCTIPSTAGDEQLLSDWILRYTLKHQSSWKHQPEIFAGDGFQEAIVLMFGRPRLAVFAHLDTVGYCTAYGDRLVPIGKPKAKTGATLLGRDAKGPVELTLRVEKHPKEEGEGKETRYYGDGTRQLERGTPLTYKPDWRETDTHVQCCYLDNRVGVWNALELCQNAQDVAIVFSTYEEHGGGAAQFLGRFLFKSFGCRQALISDVTLASEGIVQSEGVAISLRDRGIPRQRFVQKIRQIAQTHGIAHQLEVESAGGSDGNQLQASSYPWDWCFIGPPETGYHSPDESIHKSDLDAMRQLYNVLIDELP